MFQRYLTDMATPDANVSDFIDMDSITQRMIPILYIKKKETVIHYFLNFNLWVWKVWVGLLFIFGFEKDLFLVFDLFSFKYGLAFEKDNLFIYKIIFNWN